MRLVRQVLAARMRPAWCAALALSVALIVPSVAALLVGHLRGDARLRQIESRLRELEVDLRELELDLRELERRP